MSETKKGLNPATAKWIVVALAVLALVFYLLVPTFGAKGEGSINLTKVFDLNGQINGIVLTIVLIAVLLVTAAIEVIVALVKKAPFGLFLPSLNAVLALAIGFVAPEPLTFGIGLILTLICYIAIAGFSTYAKKSL